ncbi:FimV/HubP family polar landmark protein [Herbaspirillum sp. SJZ107]|uniref:FimV/HubP family polar landmark protein n=1 Tax=Herbaspirillum sp. SJZ107 TaxID=2572881 RepID=UPI00114DEDE2|nr:FimV/HubP family polar landmark protein [Herbaspirillum sp. SJZ107]TQK07780.1 pilus assembly protein FimV [Herbaspirillum sp. SJZ107]
MHSTHRLPLKSSALKKLTAAVASALVLSSAAHAAGLGKLTVLSALGQPLRAEIELTSVSPEEASGLVAKLASPEAFKTANIEFNPALLSLRFNVEQRGGRQFIRVSSSQPLNEPFVDLLLELSWNNGRLVREYTFLLDPAELRATQSAQVAAADSARTRSEAAPAAGRARADETRQAAERPAATRRAQEERAEGAARGGSPGGASSQYRVRPGDSLGKIAAQLKPAEVSLDMMLVALYRANPDAFMGNNMNRLKSGRILAVPGADAVGAIGDGEAHGVVVAHAADFNAYRNKLAGQVGAGEAEKTPRASQSGTGRISAKVEERPTAANESQDQLRLSKAAPSAPAGKGATTSTEDTIAKQRELEESQTRVKELERNITDLQKLAEVKNKAGAEAQNNASAPAAAPAAKAPDAVVTENKPVPNKLPPIKPAANAADKPAAAAPEPGLFDFIMDNLTYLGAGAAVLLLAALGIAQRRKKATGKAVSEPSILGVPTEPQHSMFAEAGGQSVDTNNSVFNSSFAPSASQLDTNEVDPVAEADVYIAYGRDAQAEEILKEALRTHPERLPVRLKLLEIYVARKDQRAFETQAGELYGITRGQGDEWAQAAALGRAIDPHNPLYAGTGAGTGLGGAAAAGLAAGAVGAGVAAAAAPAPAHDDLLSKDLDDAFLAADAADSAHGSGADAPREPMSFDQHFAGAMATAQPAAAPPAPAPAPAPAEDDNLLDFDLGGLAFEPHAADQTALPTPDVREITASNDVPDLEFDMGAFDPAPAAPAVAPVAAQVAPAAADDPLDFSFDMDFGATPAPNPVPHVDPHLADELLPVPGSAPNTDIDMANLAREFDLPDLPSELHTGVPATPETASRSAGLKDPLFDLDAMDFGLEDKRPAAQGNPAPDLAFDLHDTLDDTPPAATPALALDDDPFALPALDGLPPATPAPVESAPYAPHGLLEPQLEAPGFDLDLAAEPDTPSLPLPEVHDMGAGAELSPAHMEMETKLDLAIAYQEIGDKEGARELLDEVIKGGTGEQIGRANAMRAALA